MADKSMLRRTGASLVAFGLVVSGCLTALGVTPATAAVQDVEIGNVRVQPLSESLVRVELRGPGGFEDRSTYHVVGRDDFAGAPATVTNNGITTRVTTANYQVWVPTGATSLSGVRVTDLAGRSLWSYSGLPNSQPYLPAPGATPDVWTVSDSPRVAPPAWGYDPMPSGATDFPDFNGWDTTNNAPDVYVFLPEGDAGQLRADFTTLFGPSELIPLKALGLWHSRYWEYSEQDVYDLISQYRTRGFPLDNFVVDTDWRAAGATVGAGYTINTNLFPDMGQFLTNLRDTHHVLSIFNDHPEPVAGTTHALSAAEVAYRNQNLRNLLNMGLDAWWYDRNWSVSIVSPFSGVPKESFGMYLYQAITQSLRPDARPMIMGNVDGIDNGAFNRAPDLSSHRSTLQWTGDIASTSTALRQEVVNLVRSGALTSTPYVSADIGGHTGQPSADDFIRWSQFAALSPIFRYHTTKSQSLFREPWRFGAQAEQAAKDYIEMRYRLLPLLYGLSAQNYKTGIPIAKRLDFDYPQYQGAASDTQYLLGDGVLVAPIWEARRSNPTPIAGSWLSHDNGTGTQVPGLVVEFFNNTGLTGNPVATGVDATVDHWWSGNSPGHGINSDNFSARWTGQVTIGQEDARIGVRIDDGGRLWVDGQQVINSWQGNDSVTYWGPDLQAGTTHDIVFEYYEGSGNARAQLVAAPTVGDDSRSVFIPDGRWMDVWTGQTYDGPANVDVTHPIDTSPIFVRQGSIIPLAQNVDYIGAQPWSTIGLDVYPSTTRAGSFELYEDDGASVDYKTGAGRTTELSTAFDSGTSEVVVSVGASQGTFDGSDAFTNRTWKARLHSPTGWGAVTSATVNGTPATITPIPLDATDGLPFAIDGASRDTNVYEVTWTAPVNQASELRATFTSPQAEPPTQSGDQSIERTIWPTGLTAATPVDLSGTNDWVQLGHPTTSTVNRKSTASPLLSTPTYTGTGTTGWAGDDYRGKMSWTGGAPTASGTDVGTLMHSDPAEPPGAGFAFSADADNQWRRLDVYWGCFSAECRIEIDDGIGPVTTRRIVANPGDPAVNEKTSIFYRGPAASSLDVKVSRFSGNGNVSLAAYAVTTLGSGAVQATVSALDIPAALNLSDPTYVDWAHFTGTTSGGFNHKAAPAQQVIDDISYAPGADTRWEQGDDFRPPVSWSDGTPSAAVSGTGLFVYAWNGISAPFDIPTGSWTLEAYTSTWGSDGYYTLLDAAGDVVASAHVPPGGVGENIYRKMSFDVVAASPQTLTLYYAPGLGTNGHVGNISMPAIAVRSTSDPRPALRAALDRAAALVEADYAETAWEAFESSGIVVNAQAVWDNAAATAGDVLGAADALNAAILELQSHPWTPPAGEGTVERAVWPSGLNQTTQINLSDSNDWVHMGSQSLPVNRKDRADPPLSDPQYVGTGTPGSASDYLGAMSWNGGTPTASATGRRTLRHTPNGNHGSAYTFSAQATTEWRKLDVYWGCWRSQCRIEFTDADGNTTVRRLEAGGTAVNQKTTFFYKAGRTQMVNVKVHTVSGGGNASLAAYAVTDLPQADVSASIGLAEAPATVNLSGQRNLDWAHFGAVATSGHDRMNNPRVNAIGTITEPPYPSASSNSANDFGTEFSWSDGTPTAESSNNTRFAFSFEGLQLPLDLPAGEWQLDVYSSVWGAVGSFMLLDQNGGVIGTTSMPSPSDSQSAYGKATISLTVNSATTVTLMAVPTQSATDHIGNISIAAVALRRTLPDTPVVGGLITAVEQAEALDEADYTPQAWAEFVSSGTLAPAQEIAMDPTLYSDADIAQVTAALAAAITELQDHPRADTAELLTVITQAEGLDRDDYAPAAWALIVSGTAAARAVAGNPNASQAEVDRAVQALVDTLAILVPEVNVVIPPQLSTLTPAVDGDLEVLPGYVATDGTTITYAWSGAGSPTDQAVYTPVAGDAGQRLTVMVTITKPGFTPWTAVYTTAPVASAPTPAVPVVEPLVAPALSVLAAQEGEEIEVVPGDWNTSGVELTYAWSGAGSPVDQAVYTPVADDVGQALQVTVTASRAGFTSWSGTFTTSRVVGRPAEPPVMVVPVILPTLSDPTPAVGDTITVLSGDYTPSASESYLWTIGGALAGTGPSL
ncbi:MAG: DUF5110 domain-containing protein, partial [Bifidobacteriaceae bacterium]|nr:DUF5110 domain-containing protein [Bifidobacteriaceae bacterium]